jgi:hypothetical protein
MTYSSLSTGLQSINPDVYFARQYSFIAGPFVVYGGLITNAADLQTVTLLPATTLIYVGLITQNGTANLANQNFIKNDLVAPRNIVGNSFDIKFGSPLIPIPNQNVYYLAIGI